VLLVVERLVSKAAGHTRHLGHCADLRPASCLPSQETDLRWARPSSAGFWGAAGS